MVILPYHRGMSNDAPPLKAPARAPKKASTVRHTRAIARDRSKRTPVAPPAAEIEARLTALIHPLTLGQVAHYHALGLRERVLSLPVMVALVLSMIWRQVGSASTLVRLLHHEGLLWTAPVQVSQQALSERLRAFPADLSRRVLDDLLPLLQARWAERSRAAFRRRAGHGILRPGHLADDGVLPVRGVALDAAGHVGLVRERFGGLAHAPAGLLYLPADLVGCFAHCTSSFTVLIVSSGSDGAALRTRVRPVAANPPAISR